MVAWRFATLCLVLIVPTVAAAPSAGEEVAYEVIIDDLELMTEPNLSAYSTGTLKRGAHVQGVADRSGWVRVQAPTENFHWINAAEVEEQADGTWVVKKRQVNLRYAATSARLPGPSVRSVRKGTVVRSIDHPDLKVGVGPQAQVWHAVEATEDEVRYLSASGLALVRTEPAAPSSLDRPERPVSYDPGGDTTDLPPEVNAELTSIQAMSRSIKAASVETWNLDPVRGRYESLLRQFGTHPKVRTAIEPRLDQVRREMALARSAQEFAQLLKAGDQRDTAIAQTQRAVTLARSGSDRGYDAQGLLQPSSRRYQGQKVLALIGPEGRAISYLEIPPGVPVNQYLTHKVGVRGVVHFDEGLGARLISVRDLELIDKNR